MTNKITWQELDASFHKMSPAEKLAASTSFGSLRPIDERWLGVIEPLSEEADVVSVALALPAFTKFSSGSRNLFRSLAEQITSECSITELEVMQGDEHRRGNSGALIRATATLLRILVPNRLAGRARMLFEELVDREGTDMVVETDELM